MLQVVFGDSEKGAIKCARSFLNDMSVASVDFFCSGDCTREEKDVHIAKMREQWEQKQLRGKPLGGNSEDMIALPPALDFGDISGSLVSDERKAVITEWFSANPWNEMSDMQEHINEYWNSCLTDYKTLIERAKQGEAVRVWYSNAPYSMCGFYSVLYELRGFDCNVTAVKLPEFEQVADEARSFLSWGEVSPGDWASYLSLATEISKPVRTALAQSWYALKQENTPLRALINGQLHSVGIDFYDHFIRREINDGTFTVGQLIGSVLGKYRLGISDWLIAQRIRNMLALGELCMEQEKLEFYGSVVKKGKERA